MIVVIIHLNELLMKFSLLKALAALTLIAFFIAIAGPRIRSMLHAGAITIPAGHRVLKLERRIVDGSNGIMIPGDRVHLFLIDPDRNASWEDHSPLIEYATVFCSYSHERTHPADPCEVGVLLTNKNADVVKQKQRVGQILVDFSPPLDDNDPPDGG